MTTALVSPLQANAGPADVIAWQRECVRNEQYQILGRVWMIALEASAGAHVPGRNVANALGSRIEFYNDRGGTDVIGPHIAQTGPRGSLLLLDPFVRYDGVVGLPDIPQPDWTPPIPKSSDLTSTKAYVPPSAPMIPQHLIDRGDGHGGRARGQIRAGSSIYLVCGPVVQIVVRPLDEQNRILPNALILKCLPSSAKAGVQATLMDLLIDAQTGEPFLYGGRFEVGFSG
jgi:hypothetical protein